jgi:hypothetical protein
VGLSRPRFVLRGAGVSVATATLVRKLHLMVILRPASNTEAESSELKQPTLGSKTGL